MNAVKVQNEIAEAEHRLAEALAGRGPHPKQTAYGMGRRLEKLRGTAAAPVPLAAIALAPESGLATRINPLELAKGVRPAKRSAKKGRK